MPADIGIALSLNEMVITAVRDGSGNLKLITWRISSDGKSITRLRDSGQEAGAVSLVDIALAGNKGFITAVRDSVGRLKLIGWHVDISTGNVWRGNSDTSEGAVSFIKMISWSDSRVIIAVGDGGGNLVLKNWEMKSNGALSRVGDTALQDQPAGAISFVALARIGDSNIITAVRDDNGNLKLITWEVLSHGGIKRLSPSGQQAGAISLVDICGAAGNLVTAVRDGNGNLKLITWKVSTDGKSVKRLRDSGQVGSKIDLVSCIGLPLDLFSNSAKVVTAVRDDNGNLRLTGWQVTENGTMTHLEDVEAGAVSLVRVFPAPLAAPIYITAVRDSVGNLKLITWDISGALVINNGLKLNRRGRMDTDVAMGEFANGPHTVSGWVMPEFVNALPADVFTSVGNQPYRVGLGDYRTGNGDFKKVGDPVLTMTVGGKTVSYLAPSFSKRTWHHFVMRRTPTNADGVATFQLFVDGSHLYPSVVTKTGGTSQISQRSEIAFSPSDPLPTFSGTLRVGPHLDSIDYFYGLIDGISVHTRTLTTAEISGIAAGSMSVPTDKLIARYDFDEPNLDSAPYSRRTLTLGDPTSSYVVQRTSIASKTADAAIFDSPDYVAPTEATYRLPITQNEVWYVVQGYDDPGGSHNGLGAFSFDLRRADKAIGAVRAAAAATVYWLADGLPDSDGNEANWMRTSVSPHESVTYLHFETNSLTETFGLQFEPTPTTPEYWFQVEQDQLLGTYGDAALHLHLAGTNDYSSTENLWRVMPIAFTEYYVATSANGPWTHVSRGQPKAGQYIKRVN
jgi:hypothetical protein